MVSMCRNLGQRLLALALVASLVAGPMFVWHDLIVALIAGFHLEPGYLIVAWSGFVLMAVGVLAFLPIALTSGGDPGGRFYPRRRDTITGWGMSLYLLGLLLVVQLGMIAAA